MRQRQDKDSVPLRHTLDIRCQKKTKKSHSKSQRRKEERWQAGGTDLLLAVPSDVSTSSLRTPLPLSLETQTGSSVQGR